MSTNLYIPSILSVLLDQSYVIINQKDTHNIVAEDLDIGIISWSMELKALQLNNLQGFTGRYSSIVVESFKNFFELEYYLSNEPFLGFQNKYLDYVEFYKESLETKCIDSFKAQIIEIEEDQVIMRCLLDEEEMIFEDRYFDISPLLGLGDIKTGQFYEVRIYISPGEKKLVFNKANEVFSEFFNEPIDYLQDLSDDSIFQPLE